MESIAKVFRGKENRKHANILAKEVRRALTESEGGVCYPYTQDLVCDLIPGGYSVKHEPGEEDFSGKDHYVVFYNNNLIASFRYVNFETAVELITCAVIVHLMMHG